VLIAMISITVVIIMTIRTVPVIMITGTMVMPIQ